MSEAPESTVEQARVTPDLIMQIGFGFGFWGSKALLSAVEMGVFSDSPDRLSTGRS